MRWFWIDRFTEFVAGKRASSIKNVSLAEEQIDEYCPGFPYMPASLIIEGFAQTGGILVSQMSDFERKVVLAKINKSKFYFEPQPGDTLRYSTELVSVQEHGAVTTGVSYRGDDLHAEVELMFAYLDERFEGIEQFEPAGFCRMLRCLKLFDVGR